MATGKTIAIQVIVPEVIVMFTRMARSLRSTLESIETPSLVNAYGRCRLPPRPLFDIPIWNIKALKSGRVRFIDASIPY